MSVHADEDSDELARVLERTLSKDEIVRPRQRGLTSRERELAEVLERTLSKNEIARELDIKRDNVKVHVGHILTLQRIAEIRNEIDRVKAYVKELEAAMATYRRTEDDEAS